MWTPVTPMPITPLPDSLKPAQPQQQSYALGWGVQDYRGHRIIQHSGGVFGSITRVVMIPDRDVGFAIMMNSEDSGMILGLGPEERRVGKECCRSVKSRGSPTH